MRVLKRGQTPPALSQPEAAPHDRRGLRRGMPLLPSVFTLANLFCGWASVVHAMRGDLTVAARFIGVAIVLDMLDGRIARMTSTTSDFGGQLDSLADLVSFGMAPAALVYQWGLQPLGWVGSAAAFLFLTAAAVRLARFNVQAPTDKCDFVGMPSPAAAALVAATVFYFPGGLHTGQQALAGMALAIAPALLMVSTIPFPSFKSVDLSAHRTYQWLIILAGLIALVVSRPHEVLLFIAYGYVFSAVIGTIVSRLRSAALATAAGSLTHQPRSRGNS